MNDLGDRLALRPEQGCATRRGGENGLLWERVLALIKNLAINSVQMPCCIAILYCDAAKS
jgi:hypothetical protein